MTRGRGGRGRGRGRGGGSRGRGAGKSHPGTREEKASDGKRAQDSTTSQTDGANSVESTDGAASKHFGRRQITSNWHRYEEPLPSLDDEFSEAAEIEARREEAYSLEAFEDLMKHRRAHTGFRLRSELSVEQEQQSSSALSVNCQNLAQSLRAIPVHEQLCLDTSMLDPSTVAHFQKAAADCQTSLERHQPLAQHPHPRVSTELGQQTVPASTRDHTSAKTAETHGQQIPIRAIDDGFGHGQSSSQGNEVKPGEGKHSSSEECAKTRDDQHDVLDALLSASVKIPETVVQSRPQGQSLRSPAPLLSTTAGADGVPPGSSASRESDELDSLLAMSSLPDKSTLHVPAPAKHDRPVAPVNFVTGTSEQSADTEKPKAPASRSERTKQNEERDEELDFLLGLS